MSPAPLSIRAAKHLRTQVTLEVVDRLIHRILDYDENDELAYRLDDRVVQMLSAARDEIQVRVATDIKTLTVSDYVAKHAVHRVREILAALPANTPPVVET